MKIKVKNNSILFFFFSSYDSHLDTMKVYEFGNEHGPNSSLKILKNSLYSNQSYRMKVDMRHRTLNLTADAFVIVNVVDDDVDMVAVRYDSLVEVIIDR